MLGGTWIYVDFSSLDVHSTIGFLSFGLSLSVLLFESSSSSSMAAFSTTSLRQDESYMLSLFLCGQIQEVEVRLFSVGEVFPALV